VSAVIGKLLDLMPEHPESNLKGALCPGRFGKHLTPGVLSLRFIWEKGLHYHDHRYEGIAYEWMDTEFRRKIILEPRYAYESWQEAAKELGFEYQRDFVRMLLPEAR
jgi:hypothetical protein